MSWDPRRRKLVTARNSVDRLDGTSPSASALAEANFIFFLQKEQKLLQQVCQRIMLDWESPVNTRTNHAGNAPTLRACLFYDSCLDA